MPHRFYSYTNIRGGRNLTRGYRPFSELPIVPGAGGGWLSLLLSLDTDGKPIGEDVNFAQGGIDCGRSFSNLRLFGEVNGGFGGGGGQCGGGGEGEATLEELYWVLETIFQEEVATQFQSHLKNYQFSVV